MSLSEVQALAKRTSNILVPQSLIPRRVLLAVPSRSAVSCWMSHAVPEVWHGTSHQAVAKRYRKGRTLTFPMISHIAIASR